MGTRMVWCPLLLILAFPALGSAQSALTPVPTPTLVPTLVATPIPDGRVVVPVDDGLASDYEAQKSDLKTPVKTDQVKQALSVLDEKKDAKAEEPSVGTLDDDLGEGPELGAPAKGEKVKEALSALNGDQIQEEKPVLTPTATPTPGL